MNQGSVQRSNIMTNALNEARKLLAQDEGSYGATLMELCALAQAEALTRIADCLDQLLYRERNLNVPLTDTRTLP